MVFPRLKKQRLREPERKHHDREEAWHNVGRTEEDIRRRRIGRHRWLSFLVCCHHVKSHRYRCGIDNLIELRELGSALFQCMQHDRGFREGPS